MKALPLALILNGCLLAAISVGHAQPIYTHPAAAVAPIPPLAAKTPFITGLDEPQGLVLDKNGDILLADYGAGSILRFSPTGKAKGTLATGLKSPSLMVKARGFLYVAERKNNRVVKIGENGKITPVGGSIPEPLGLTASPDGTLYTVSHTTSVVYRFDGKAWQEIYRAPAIKGDKAHYGYRGLAYDSGALLLSDEGSGQIFVLTQGGRLAPWIGKLEDPSGILVASNDTTYLTDESAAGGTLLKIARNGARTVVAEGLGRARDILQLDAKTLLVSNRDGTVWKIALN